MSGPESRLSGPGSGTGSAREGARQAGSGAKGGPVEEARYLRACRRLPVDTTPVWFMRQAGRALPEYRAIRRRASLAECIADPALAAEITLLPVERLGVDAAILFADITTPLTAIGAGVRLADEGGPVVEGPVETVGDVDRLAELVADAVGAGPGGSADDGPFASTATAIRLVRRSSPVPVIGFAGGPFTLACYLVEGAARRSAVVDFPTLRLLLRREPGLVERLLGVLAELTLAYLRVQVRAGAASVVLFDSWVGGLSPADYRRFVAPWTGRLVGEVAALGVPVTLFGTGTAGLLPDLAASGADVVGLDWRIELDDGWRRIGFDRGVQGNLDPWLLLGPWSEVEAATGAILAAAAGRPGHVFNLGHGVHPETDPDVLRRLVDLVHEAGRGAGPGTSILSRAGSPPAGGATGSLRPSSDLRASDPRSNGGTTMSTDLSPAPAAGTPLLPYRHDCPADADPFAPRLPAGESGPARSLADVGILLMAYGGPSSVAEIAPYYTDIRSGRPPSEELLGELVERYEAIGGHSPLPEVTERQRAALEAELARRGRPLPVVVGYKHSAPFVADAVGRLVGGGVRRILALALAPHFSTMTACSYCTRVDAARRALASEGAATVRYAMVGDWHAEPGFIDALAEVTAAAIAELDGGVVQGASLAGAIGRGEAPFSTSTWVVFSAHSLPERIVAVGDPYPELLRETARLVAERLGLANWSFAFQSAGRTADAWLGPDLLEELARLAAAGVRSVVVSSVGFVASNLELLYDIDIEARQRAHELGLRLLRARALDDHPRLIGALADIVERALEGSVVSAGD